MISSDWNYDTVVSRFVTARLSSLAKTDDTIPGFSLPVDREFVSEHKLFEPIPHHRVSQILFLFGRHNEMWVRVSLPKTQAIPPSEAGIQRREGYSCQQSNRAPLHAAVAHAPYRHDNLVKHLTRKRIIRK